MVTKATSLGNHTSVERSTVEELRTNRVTLTYICSGVTNLQTESYYLDSFKTYCIVTDLDFLGPSGGQMGARGIYDQKL